MRERTDDGVEEFFREQAKPENRRKLALWASKLESAPAGADLVACSDQAPAGSACDMGAPGR